MCAAGSGLYSGICCAAKYSHVKGLQQSRQAAPKMV